MLRGALRRLAAPAIVPRAIVPLARLPRPLVRPAARLSTAPPAEPGGGVLGVAKSWPFTTNIVIATLKTAFCDFLVQKYIEKKEKVDWRRNAVFWVFGAVYLGGAQWFLYVTLFKRWWPGMAAFSSQPFSQKLRNVQGLRDLVKQVTFDNFVHYPIVYFPVFYVLKQSIQDPEVSVSSIVQNAMSKYRQNCVEDNVKMWLMWIPGEDIDVGSLTRAALPRSALS